MSTVAPVTCVGKEPAADTVVDVPSPGASKSDSENAASPSATAAEPRFADGTMFAERYRIDGVLGRGGMGEVYRAFDTIFQRAVALKIVRVEISEDPPERRQEAKRRLLNEARVVFALKHPHIVEVYDAGESEGLPYLVLELCDGGNLRKAMADGATQGDRLRWLREISEALAYAHDQGIVHRDVKPENVILTADRKAKVTDFGIAKALKGDRTGYITLFGIAGTPRYMAPEQFAGEHVDARVDQYAWGVVAHELLTGAHWALPAAESHSDDHSVTGTPSVPPHLRHVIARATAREPRARYESFYAILAELQPATRRVTSWRLAIVASAALIVAGAGLVAMAHRPLRTANPSVHGNGSESSSAPDRVQEDRQGRNTSLFAAVGEHDSPFPDARAAYEAAFQLWIDASPQDALHALTTATNVDKAFARAHLLYALIDNDRQLSREGRQHYQLAAQHRSKLSGRERELLDALAPSMGDPANLAETRRVLAHLEQQTPDDPDIPVFIANRYLASKDGEHALPFADRAMLWPRPVARLMRARVLAQLGRLEESRAEYAQCFASSPSATGCLCWSARVESGAGRCENVESLGRRLIATSPDNPDGYYFLAGGLAGQSSSIKVIQPVLEQRWPAIIEQRRSWVRLQDTFYLQVSAGAFIDAERTLDAWEADAARFSDADNRGLPAIERMVLNFELGRTTSAAALARNYLEQSRAWTEGVSIVFDMEAYRVLYWTGAIDRAEFGRLRDEWLIASERLKIAGMYNIDLYRWYQAFVEPVADTQDALLALSRRPVEMEAPNLETMHTQLMQMLGRMYLLAGRIDEALPFLKGAVESCQYSRPVHRMLANLDYARALAKIGDYALALRSLDFISQQWGNEPRSKTNREARELSVRLRAKHAPILPDGGR